MFLKSKFEEVDCESGNADRKYRVPKDTDRLEEGDGASEELSVNRNNDLHSPNVTILWRRK